MGPRKFVFDSIVAVPFASWGRLRNARKPPAESARLISAPPWSMPPAVHLSALHASRLRTSSREAETNSIPRNPVNGAAAATCAVSSGSAVSTAVRLPSRRERKAPGDVSSEAARDITPAAALERNWWLRAAAVLVAPRAVFVSLRADDVEEREARQ